MSPQELILQEISSMSAQQLTKILNLIRSIKDIGEETLDNWYDLSIQG
jgi:hypothetical protein